MKKPTIIVVILVVVIALLGAGGAFYYYYFVPNTKVVPAFEEGEVNLVVEGERVITEEEIRIANDEILLPFQIVKKYIDPHIYWDNKIGKVTITTKDRVIRMKTDSLNALINNKPMALKIPVVKKDEVVYVPIEFLSDFYNISIRQHKTSNAIIIDFKTGHQQIAEPISKKAVVRNGHSIRYPIIRKYESGLSSGEEDRLRVFGEYEKWYKVRTYEGAIGYIEKKHVTVKSVNVGDVPETAEKAGVWKPQKGKINLVWDMIYMGRPNLSKIGDMNGLDVISPTWFQVADEHGKLVNRADAKYVEWAHKRGYKVWALLGNDFGNTKMTSKLLNNTDARDNLIREVLTYSSLYQLDGINIDFENINIADKDALTQFVRELTPFLKQQGLIVSMDVTVMGGSDNWSKCYDREALGEVVDYIMLMAYDQHWAKSPIAGSVAQLTWVEKNLERVLSVVPKEKLILGLPFYTRLWEEKDDGKGGVKVSSPKALSMVKAQEMVKANGAKVQWDEESGQFYTQFKKDNSTYKIWLEDTNSINLKSSLIQKYDLAGAASWKRNDETPQIWEVLNSNLKGIKNYQEWLDKNKNRTYVYGN